MPASFFDLINEPSSAPKKTPANSGGGAGGNPEPSIGERFKGWSEKKVPITRPIPVEDKELGTRIKSGISHPREYANSIIPNDKTLSEDQIWATLSDYENPDMYKSNDQIAAATKGRSLQGATPTNENASGYIGESLSPMQSVETIPGIDTVEGTNIRGSNSVASSAAAFPEIINDFVGRFANLRKSAIDKPQTHEDDPKMDYTFSSGDVFDDSDLQKFYTLPNGKTIQLSNPVYDETTGLITLGDNTQITEEDYNAAEPAYAAFPNGVIKWSADGKLPEGQEQWGTRQKENPDANWFDRSTNMDVANPRAPWQDTASRNPWDKGYDTSNIVGLSEIVPSVTDMTLSSLPYMVNPWAAGVVAGSQVAPVMGGYDPDTYIPPSNGLFDYKTLGEGTYAPGEMTQSQQVGGIISPPFEMAVERMGGELVGKGRKAVGGVLPFVQSTKVGDWFAKTRPRQMAMSAATEGAEEFLSPFVNELAEAGAYNYGKEPVYNPVTNETDYKDATLAQRFGNVIGKGVEGGSSGALLGGLLSGGGLGIDYVKGKGKPLAPVDLSKDIPSSLTNRYEFNEELAKKYENNKE